MYYKYPIIITIFESKRETQIQYNKNPHTTDSERLEYKSSPSVSTSPELVLLVLLDFVLILGVREFVPLSVELVVSLGKVPDPLTGSARAPVEVAGTPSLSGALLTFGSLNVPVPFSVIGAIGVVGLIATVLLLLWLLLLCWFSNVVVLSIML